MAARQKKREFAFNYAMGLFVVALVLMAWGLVTVYASSAALSRWQLHEPSGDAARLEGAISYHSAGFLKRQTVWGCLGFGAMLFFAYFKYNRLKRLAPWMLGVSVVALILVLFCEEVNGSRRWLGIGGLGVQPSEFAKLSLALFMACFFSKRSDRIHEIVRCGLPAAVICGGVLGLILLEPDFGATVVLGALVFSIWLVAGARLLHVGLLGVCAVPAVGAMVWLAPYRMRRLTAFINPEAHLRDGGYQLHQSQIALGSGGTQGVGLGQSMQKYQFLSEAHNDFIAAILGEETGLVGMTILLLLFGALIFMGLRVAYQTPDFFGILTAYAMTAMIGLSALINLGVVTGCLPTKGLALPFVSYGGSSMLVNCCALGILMNIAAANYAQRRG